MNIHVFKNLYLKESSKVVKTEYSTQLPIDSGPHILDSKNCLVDGGPWFCAVFNPFFFTGLTPPPSILKLLRLFFSPLLKTEIVNIRNGEINNIFFYCLILTLLPDFWTFEALFLKSYVKINKIKRY